jgi:hypothetical protein
MPFIYGVLKEEYERLKEIRQDYENKLQQLPRGTLVKKRIGGHDYNYLAYRSGGKVVTDYIKSSCLDETSQQLERRKKIEEALAGVKIDMGIIEKVVKDE